MNFKSVLSVTVLALLGMVNAAPLTKTLLSVFNDTKTHPAATKAIPTSYINKTNEKITAIVDGCKAKSGIPVITSDSSDFVCIISYGSQDEIPKESTCFYQNENTVLCIDEEYTSFKSCTKSNDEYSYFSCNFDVHTFVNKEKQHGLILSRPLVTYPERIRYAIAPRMDQKECKNNNGLVFSYQSIFQYLCLYPESNFESIENKHCVTIDSKPYCNL